MSDNAQSNALYTLAPIQAQTPFNPEFVDYKGLAAIFGIKRSLAYQLIAEGKIRSVLLRRQGQARGKRLFAVESVREFLRKQMNRQQ